MFCSNILQMFKMLNLPVFLFFCIYSKSCVIVTEKLGGKSVRLKMALYERKREEMELFLYLKAASNSSTFVCK